MRGFRGAIAAVVVIAGTIAAVEVLWRSDFAPFEMTIVVVDSQCVGLSDGSTLPGETVLRLAYRDRRNWTLVTVSDVIPGWSGAAPGQGAACRDGVYGHLDTRGVFHPGDGSGDGCVNAPDRWIGYGIAWGLPWERRIEGNVVTYTSAGERVSFDRRSGLPLEYEAGLGPRATGHRYVRYERR